MNASDLHKRVRHSALVAVAGALLATNIATQSSASTDDSQASQVSAMTATGCDEVFAFILVDQTDLDPLVPDRFPLKIVGGQAQVMVTHRHCEAMTIGGVTRNDTREARFGAVVSRGPGSTTNCGPPDADICNFYTFFWAADNAELVGWLREETAVGPEIAVYVENLHHAYSPIVTEAYESLEVLAPTPAPSPFRLSARLSDTTNVGPLTANWWVETDEGIVRFAGTTPEQQFGTGDGWVEPTSQGTVMWQLFDGEARPFAGPFSASRVEDLTYSKCMIGPSTTCSDSPVVLFGDCVDVVAFIDEIERDPVDDAVPEPFEPISLPGDTTVLFVHALWCDPNQEGEGGAAIHGQVRPTLVAQFSAVIDKPATGSDATCPVCDWYMFDWVTDNGELVGWLHDGTGLGRTARHGALELSYDRAGAGENLSLNVPGLFEMRGRLDDARRYPVFPTTVKGGYWSLTHMKVVKIPSWNDTSRLSPVPIELAITPEYGTLMWELFGEQTRTARNPFGSIAFSCGFYQKQVFATPEDAQQQPDPGPCS